MVVAAAAVRPTDEDSDCGEVPDGRGDAEAGAADTDDDTSGPLLTEEDSESGCVWEVTTSTRLASLRESGLGLWGGGDGDGGGGAGCAPEDGCTLEV